MKTNFELKGLKEIYNLTKEEISIIADNNINAISKNKEGVIVKVELIGEILEKGNLLLEPEIVKNIKVKNADVVLTDEELKVNNRKFKFNKSESALSEIYIGEKIATLTTKDYEKIINVEYALAKDNARPIIKNVCVNNDDIVALDGYRMAIRKNEVEFEADNNNFLIPDTIIKLMKKIKPNNTIEIYRNKNLITMKIDNISLTATFEEGNYVNYKGLLPQDHKIETEINSKEVLEILKGYDKDSKVFKMDISKEKMILKNSNEKFTIEDEIEVISNDEILLAMNPNYLRDALNNYDDKVSIRFNSNVQPFYIEKNGYYDLLLPIRINN